MKKVFLFFSLVFITLTLASCKPNFKKYHDWLYEEVPFEITENIMLPMETKDGKYIIRWRSNNSNIMNDFGVFKRPIETVEFKLHYTMYDLEGVEVYKNSLTCMAIGEVDRI